MTDLNHISYNKEISFIELLINLWNFKKVFFYILVPLIILSFFFDTFIPKKSKNIFRLQHPFKINLDVYPAESTLSSVVLYNLGSMNIQNINIRDQKISIDFYSSYFKPRLMSKKFLIEFAEMNNDKYNLVEYINKNNVSVLRERERFKFSLILPDHESNSEFVMEYLNYVKEITINSFRLDVLRHLDKELKTILYDMDRVYQILENKNDSNNIFKENINIIMTLYDSRKIQLEQNITFFINLKSDLGQDWILDDTTKIILNEKFYKVTKYLLTVILSLIFYLFYVFIKLAKQDKKH